MLLDKTLILKVLKEIKKEIISKYMVKDIGLFGSYVKDMQNDSSDIDFLVEFEKGADLFHFMGLIFFLEEKFNRKVDVISKPALKEDLKENILQEVMYEYDIKDIKKAILSIESFVEGMNFEEFNNDDKTTSAVLRKLEIIGEATKSISNTIRDKYTQIPWKEMAGMRDRLIHGYSEVDFNLVWETIQKKLTELKSEIQKILDE